MTDVVQDTREDARIRTETAEWLAKHWDPERPRAEFRADVVDAGYAAVTWPIEWYGRGLTTELARVVQEEFARAGAPGGGQEFGIAPNVILGHGSDELKKQFLRPLLVGEISTCLLYSEPSAGSDLAGVQTNAERHGDEWIVNGQKVWTSGAMTADYGLLIARTDWDAPKHQGITYFFFPMKQAGVEVRPIKQITGGASFNEVFFSDARVPDSNRVGQLNDGWQVLMTALAYERVVMGGSRGGAAQRRGGARTERVATVEGGADFVALAKQNGRNADPATRQAIAELYTLRMVNRWNGQRARAKMQQGSSSPEASFGKLAMSRILHSSAHLNALVLGAEGMLNAQGSTAASVHFSGFMAYMTSIGGGTDQIQRNILGERILGLPKEPDVDREIAFKYTKRSAATRRFGQEER